MAEQGETESLQTASNAMNDVKPNSDSKQPQKEKLRDFFKKSESNQDQHQCELCDKIVKAPRGKLIFFLQSSLVCLTSS